MIAAGCVAYLGAFTSSYREELTDKWVEMLKELKIPGSPVFKYKILTFFKWFYRIVKLI